MLPFFHSKVLIELALLNPSVLLLFFFCFIVLKSILINYCAINLKKPKLQIQKYCIDHLIILLLSFCFLIRDIYIIVNNYFIKNSFSFFANKNIDFFVIENCNVCYFTGQCIKQKQKRNKLQKCDSTLLGGTFDSSNDTINFKMKNIKNKIKI
ncbi:hypothetical protein RFI_37823 [Reticulomyxa filosa]|uniref:Transmembrane protein n=1 Tax=Reticulomyxa filosa TaxID=46433 RepID=X6LC91_RETFI|nr:hypothetical protein RFI_37823 [Reticulomyxa filosa]|eukprot:ETN99647.1 hypothetical protein RFI_37823 [Reticulomyxa filosa]